MKLLLFSLLLVSLNVAGQHPVVAMNDRVPFDAETYALTPLLVKPTASLEVRLKRAETMKGFGIAMTVVGAGLMTGGIVHLSNYKKDNSSNSYYDDTVDIDEVGIYLVAGGVDLVVGGIVLWAIGGHNIKKYKRQQANLSFDMGKRGPTLALRF